MSIQSEITRISGNVSDSLDAVSAKGVTVPSGSNSDDLAELIAQITSSPTLQSKTNIAPTTSSQTITADAGYDGLSSVQINAMPSGTAGTPTATKGTVSNHTVAVTPSVTNTTGYITGGTKTGTAVTVSASELVSGTKSISSNGTAIDVTNYASVDVAVSPSLQSKNKMFAPAESEQWETITADTGYDGLSSVLVTVRPIPENYVYSTIPRRDSTDLAVSGYTVTVPIGYYASWASKTVNVPFVKGSFTTGSSSGSSYIDLPYTGNGYPIAVMVFLHDGTYNPNSSVYSVVKRYGILAWSMTKAVTSTAPVYGSTSGVDENMGVVNAVYKSSTSDATAVTTSVNKAANVYLATAAGNAYYTAVRVRSNTRLGYYVIGNSSFGLMPSTTYDYVVIYSS